MRIDILRSSPVFAKVAPEALEAASELFHSRVVPTAGHVWFEEQPSDEMAMVVSGELSVRVGVQEVGAVRPGELVGEASAFHGESRVATVVATVPTELLVVARSALLDLRRGHTEVYDRLVERALEAVARRVQETGRRIAVLGNGGVEPAARKAPSMLSRLLRAGTDAGDLPAPGAVPTLLRMPGLRDLPVPLVRQIATALRPRRLNAGEVLFLEGEPGDSVFILVEGQAEVLRGVRGGRAQRLATLGGGAVFGTGSLLLREPRNASVRVTEGGWAYEMNRATHDALVGDAGRAWRESLLAALRFQVHAAVGALAQLKGGTSYAQRQRLRAAAERLSSWSGADPIEDPWTWRGLGAR